MRFIVPADVPASHHDQFMRHYNAMTKETGKLFILSGDQRIEHFMKDFYGPSIPPENMDPRHLFRIADQARVGAFATHLGLVARYGKEFPATNYVIKLNAKTDLIPADKRDPLSLALHDIHDVVTFKKESGLSITGIGYTVYLGSEYESQMLSQAAHMVYQAHQNGLVAILWMYPRGLHVTNERDTRVIAGAAGVAPSLGADFAKINPPKTVQGTTNPELLRTPVSMAGNTKLLCSGGKAVDPEEFLQTLADQLTIGGVSGCAVGRNIYQRQLPQAISIAQAVAALVYDNASFDTARKLLG